TTISATEGLTQTVDNSGTMKASGTLSFVGAPGSTFNNLSTGVIDMRNGSATDKVTTSAGYNYVGSPGAQLGGDIDLSQNNTSQHSDLLLIGGTASGTTAVSFNVLNRGAFSATPIPVISAPGGATFTVANPQALTPFGLVTYSFEQIAPGNW